MRRLGRGAFAEVWLAQEGGEHGFSKRVALKVLTETGQEGAPRFAALANEARICGHLHHPHIVDVYGVGEERGLSFIAMEFVDGATLEDLLGQVRGSGIRLPRSVVLDIGIQVAQALDHAHGARADDGTPLGIVHRDLKPANVMIARQGGVKVTDFGIAKAATNIDATATGTLKGTPCYVAPEVWQGGREFLPRIDLFALGAILWEMVVLRRLLGAESVAGLAGQALLGNADEEAAALAPLFPELAPVVRRLIERDPERRTQKASRLASELQEIRRRVEAPGDIDLFVNLLGLARTRRKERLEAMIDLDIPPTEEPGWSQVIRVLTGDQPTLPESGALDLPDAAAAACRAPSPRAPRPGGGPDLPVAPATARGSAGSAGPVPLDGPALGDGRAARARLPVPLPDTEMVARLDTEDEPHVPGRADSRPAKVTRSLLMAVRSRGAGPGIVIYGGLGVAALLVLVLVGLLFVPSRGDGRAVPAPAVGPEDGTPVPSAGPSADPSVADPRAALAGRRPADVAEASLAPALRASAPGAAPGPSRAPDVTSGAPDRRAPPGAAAATARTARPEPAVEPPRSEPAHASVEPAGADGLHPSAAPLAPEQPAHAETPAPTEPAAAEPSLGCVVFQSVPGGAAVWLDGQPSGLVARSGESALRRFDAGSTVRVGMGMGGQPLAETTLQVTAGDTHVVRCDLVQREACSVRVQAGGCR